MRCRVAMAVVAVAAAVAPAARAAVPTGEVTIRRGAEGTPHIRATTWEALGYGYARAHARDNLCVLADAYATVRGERSRHFGPDGTYALRNTDTTPNNLASDFYWARVAKNGTVERLLQAPDGPAPEVDKVVRGYTAGYNDFIAEEAPRSTDPRCAGQDWVKPIREIDVYRRFYQLALLASQMVALDGIGGAQPPTPARPEEGEPENAARRAIAATPPHELARLDRPFGGGSNALALGRDATDNGLGMLLGNPHQPWQDAERFFQSHLTIPGKIDVAGASLYGVPAINIGYTKDLAWSHTVSTARRFAIVELQLVPGSPTTYVVDGRPKEMKRTTVTVQVKDEDGSLREQTRTLYETDYGPVTTSLQGLPIFPWTPARAFAMFDANADNYGRLLNHFFEVNRAGSVPELQRILKRHRGIPWVNTIAADRAGNAYYADIGSIPNVPDEKIASCSTATGRALDEAARVQVLDGSRSACPPDGILPVERMPELLRGDYTENSNDSYWLSNARTRIEGFDRIIGEERTQRSLRTRMAFTIVEDQLRDGGRFSLRALQDAMFNNRLMSEQLWRAELIAMCREEPGVPPQACDVLERWSGRDDHDAPGALLFRRFAERARGAQPSPFRTPFDPDDPVGTPSGLATDNPQVRDALHGAIEDVQSQGLPLDAPLSTLQYETRGERIPLHGGPDRLGLFNVIDTVYDPERGYTDVGYGATYIQAVQFTNGGCGLEARTVLGHSLSTDPTSPWFANGTKLFRDKQWVDQPFCERDVEQRTQLVQRFGSPERRARRRARRRLLSGVRFRRGRLTFRLRRAASVRVRVRRGGRLVRRIAISGVRGRQGVRLRLPRGRYRVTVVARAGRERVRVRRTVRVRRAT
ncbi:MAG TPA: penicillin acylase family protein, partial [Solirubrobacteraceae bacterium]|nr:penicillin acylase family protein [Solirubrobacteraceae bacterium]